ncbi:MAG: ABC transporter ATP-binding protein [Rhizomicrobium sp.]
MDTKPLSSTDVAVRGLTRRFGATTVLRGLDLDIAGGEFVALLGRSGSGKTTFLRTLAGLDPVSEGDVRLPATRAVVFQEPRLMPWKKVWQNVTLGLNGGDARERAVAALKEVGLEHRLDAWPVTLSGGEAQRVALARALVREPRLLLLDEPFAALDALTRIRMHELVSALWAAHRPSVLLVTHDVDEALLLADRALVLENGRIRTELKITQPHPRARAMMGFSSMRAELLSALGVDVDGTISKPADLSFCRKTDEVKSRRGLSVIHSA